MRQFNRFSDAEGLRLMQAFFHITQPEQRRRVTALPQKRASQSDGRAVAAGQRADEMKSGAGLSLLRRLSETDLFRA